MIKIRVWFKDEETNESCLRELRNLKPRRYMCGWDFNKCLKYIQEELEWENIKKEQIECIEFYNEKEQWLEVINKE